MEARLARAAGQADPIARLDAALLRVVRVYFQNVLVMPDHICGAPRLRADIVLGERPARGQDQREARPRLLVGRDIFRDHEPALAAHKAADVHDRRPFGRLCVARPLDGAQLLQLFI